MDDNRRRRLVLDYVAVPPRKRACSPPSHRPHPAKRGRTSQDSPELGDSISAEDAREAPSKYEPYDDEIDEIEDLEIYGETIYEASQVSDDEDEAEVPVRRLDDFYIYHLSTLEIVSAEALEQLDSNNAPYGASGIVRPWVEDGIHSLDSPVKEDSDSDSGSLNFDSYDGWDRVKLTKILEYNVHHVQGDGSLDPKIYIRTQHAWYILGRPANSDRSLYRNLWTRQRLAHLFLSVARGDGRLSYKDFCRKISDWDEEENTVVPTEAMLSRKFMQGDIESPEVQAYLVSTTLELEKDLNITRSALVRALKSCITASRSSSKDTTPESESESESEYSDHVSESESELSDHVSESKYSDRVSDLKKTRGAGKRDAKAAPIICTTPIVSRLARNLFQVEMNSLDHSSDPTGIVCEKESTKAHPFNAEKVQWGRGIRDNVWEDVYIDGVHYRVGDVVMVVPDEGYSAPNNDGRTINTYGSRYWFCQIQYFFENTSKTKGVSKLFHGQWFLHGSRTLLNELSHPGALYLLNSCNDNELDCIFQKCNFQLLQPGDPEPPEHALPDTNDFHCRMLYDEDHAEFVDLPNSYFSSQSEAPYCGSCSCKEEEEEKETPQKHDNSSFFYGGHCYHIHDFVYLVPTEDSKLLNIGQITEIFGDGDWLQFTVRYLKRHVEYLPQLNSQLFLHSPQGKPFFDERKLVLTDSYHKHNPAALSGICYVQHLVDQDDIDSWVQHNDHFYITQVENQDCLQLLPKSSFVWCKICMSDRQTSLKEIQEFVDGNNKLVAMELFSGAGGLGLGMELSQFVETRYAVEFFDSAALTFQKNHPNTKVYCQDSNLLLKQAVAEDNGENPPPLVSLNEQIPCPKMPSKQDGIDFILGGPPCQGFSRMNHNRQPDDFRTSMPCNMLSFAEHYEPSYFLLENVLGMLDFNLLDKRWGDEGTVIKWGMVKFILRALIALGYQVRWKIMQAAHYGVPQSRHRLIIWGAKHGLALPKFPVPTHAFQKSILRPLLPGTIDMRPPPSSRAVDGSYHQCAPFLPITVFDAIGDLPAFDWKNPHLIVQKSKSRQEERVWLGKPIPQLDAIIGGKDDRVGYIQGGHYASEPMNQYQKWLRQGMVGEKGQNLKVEGQYTKCFTAGVVEKTATVPLRSKATHRDLPLILQPHMARPGAKQAKKVFYGRVDGNDYFKCTLTQVTPNIKNTWPLHPLQKRIYSVRELARAQGFPDHYVFYSTSTKSAKAVQDQIKQIGNAVAVPFALALGKELGAARILDWQSNRRAESPVF